MEPVRERLAELAPGVELLENLRFDPGEEKNDPGFVATLVDGQDALRRRRVRRRPSRPRVDRRAAAHAPERRGPSARPRGRGAARDARQAEAPVRRGPRRCEGERQARRDRRAARRSSTRSSSAAPCASRFSPRRAHRSVTRCSSPTRWMPVASCSRAASRSTCRPTSWRLVADGGRGARRAATRLPDGWKGSTSGPARAAAFADVIADASTVFWNGPMGVFEDERFAAGTRAVARCGRRRARLHRRGWGRQRRRTGAVRAGRPRRPRVHRWGSLARAARAGRPARVSRRCGKRPMPVDSAAQAAHQRQLEDAPQSLRGDPDRAEAALPARRRTTTTPSTCRCTRRSPTCASCRPLIESDHMPIILGAQNCHWEQQGAFTGEVIADDARQARTCATSSSGHSERRQLFGETDEMRQQEGRGRARARHDADHVRRARRSRSARPGDTEARSTGQVARPAWRGRPRRQVGGDGHRLRADLGHRHRPHRDARRRPGRVRRDPRGGRRRSAGSDAAAAVRIQYGGSVKPGNIAELMARARHRRRPGRRRQPRPRRVRARSSRYRTPEPADSSLTDVAVTLVACTRARQQPGNGGAPRAREPLAIVGNWPSALDKGR